MAVRPIILWPNEKLHQRSTPVDPQVLAAGGYDQLALDLLDTMYAHDGVGLSAVQVGEHVRLFVMDVTNKDWVFFNPRIVAQGGGFEEKNEGCLSLPGVYEQVSRWNTVTVEALDRNGEAFEHVFHSMEAQCFQHESEHLDGVVLPDKLTPLQRDRLRAHMRKLERRS